MRKRFITIILVIAFFMQTTACGTGLEGSLKTAGSYVEQENYEKAMELYQKIIERYPEDPIAYKELADLCKMQGLGDLLEFTLLSGIESVKEPTELYIILAEYYMDQEQYEKAIETYKNILNGQSADRHEIEELISKALDGLALQHINEKEYNKAEEIYKEKLEKNSVDAQAYEALMGIYIIRQGYRPLLDLYEQYNSEINSSNADVMAAYTYHRTRDRENRDRILDYLSYNTIEDPKLLALIAEILLEENQQDEATELIEIIRSRDGNAPIVKAFDYSKSTDLSLFAVRFADVNGDGEQENILLMAQGSPFEYAEDYTILIQNGSTGDIIIKEELDFTGYFDDLFVGDFTGDKIPEVKASIFSGGTAGIVVHYIYSFTDNIIAQLEFDDGELDFRFIDGTKVEITYSELGIHHDFIVNLSQEQRDVYKENNYHLQSDSYLGYFRGSYLTAIDMENDGVYELEYTTQLVFSANYNADSIANVKLIYKWDGSKLDCVDIIVEPANGTDDVDPTDANPIEGNQGDDESQIGADDIQQGVSNINEVAIGFIEKLYKKGDTYYMDIDYVEFYRGDKAVEEAKKDGFAYYDEELGEWVLFNDYYIRNNNPKIRTFPIALEADIKGDGIIDYKEYTTKEFVDEFANSPYSLLYHIEVKDGVVVRMWGQYIP